MATRRRKSTRVTANVVNRLDHQRRVLVAIERDRRREGNVFFTGPTRWGPKHGRAHDASRPREAFSLPLVARIPQRSQLERRVHRHDPRPFATVSVGQQTGSNYGASRPDKWCELQPRSQLRRELLGVRRDARSALTVKDCSGPVARIVARTTGRIPTSPRDRARFTPPVFGCVTVSETATTPVSRTRFERFGVLRHRSWLAVRRPAEVTGRTTAVRGAERWDSCGHARRRARRYAGDLGGFARGERGLSIEEVRRGSPSAGRRRSVLRCASVLGLRTPGLADSGARGRKS